MAMNVDNEQQERAALESELQAQQARISRLRFALAEIGGLFGAARQHDPLIQLRHHASDLLGTEDINIIMPATINVPNESVNTLFSPISIGRRVIGRIEARRDEPFDQDERLIASVVGTVMGAVLEHSALNSQFDQLKHQIQASSDTLEQLLSFGRHVVNGVSSTTELALQLVTRLPAMVGGDRASLLLIPFDSPDTPLLVVSNGTVAPLERALALRDHGFAGLVLRERRSLIVDETETDQRWLALRDHDSISPTRCAMAVPLFWAEQVVGSLTVTTTHSHVFSTTQLNLLELAACHVSLALRSADFQSQLAHLSEIFAAYA